jgi:hypothetical protein
LGSDERVGAGAQTGTMFRARLIVFPVDRFRFQRIPLAKQIQHQHHVCLFDDLRGGGETIPTAKVFMRMQFTFHQGYEREILQVEKAIKLWD